MRIHYSERDMEGRIMSFKIFSRITLSLLTSSFMVLTLSPDSLAAKKGPVKQDRQAKKTTPQKSTTEKSESWKQSPSTDLPDSGRPYDFVDFTGGILEDGPFVEDHDVSPNHPTHGGKGRGRDRGRGHGRGRLGFTHGDDGHSNGHGSGNNRSNHGGKKGKKKGKKKGN
jgi:hypothetical protein